MHAALRNDSEWPKLDDDVVGVCENVRLDAVEPELACELDDGPRRGTNDLCARRAHVRVVTWAFMRRSALLLALVVCACTKPVAPSSAAPAPVTKIETPASGGAIAASAGLQGRCVSNPAGRLELLPGAATVVVGVDIAALWASELYRENRHVLDEPETKTFLDAAVSCNLGLERWQRATFATDAMSRDFAVVLTIDGIGRAENLACLHGALPRTSATAPWTKVADGERERYDFDGGSAGWVLDECNVLVATQTWIEPVGQLLDGGGRSVLGGALEPAIRRAVGGRHIWFAGIVPAAMTSGSLMEGMANVSGSLDVSSGVAMTTSLAFANASLASAKALELRKKFTDTKSAFAAVGMPQTLLDRVQINAQGPMVTIEGNANHDELAKITEMMKRL
jgi:hypothetical protein